MIISIGRSCSYADWTGRSGMNSRNLASISCLSDGVKLLYANLGRFKSKTARLGTATIRPSFVLIQVRSDCACRHNAHNNNMIKLIPRFIQQLI